MNKHEYRSKVIILNNRLVDRNVSIFRILVMQAVPTEYEERIEKSLISQFNTHKFNCQSFLRVESACQIFFQSPLSILKVHGLLFIEKNHNYKHKLYLFFDQSISN